MKRFAVAVIAALLISSQLADAAPKSISASEITKVAAIAEHEGATISSQGITIFSNVEKKVLLSSLDFTGTEKWKLVIEGSADQIGMAATSDREGNTWLAGLTSAVEAVESQSATKISATGTLLSGYSDSATSPLFLTAISHSSSGISILGDRGAGNVLINSTLTGKFSTAKTIGTAKSAFTSIVRNSDGSAQIYGLSSETLGGKKLVGVRDGILAKVNKSGALTSVVRSSANRATRSWQSATSSYFLVGDVKVSGKNESAFTKFNSSFVPTWTLRLPSQGAQLAAVAASGAHYALFNSSSSIPGVTGWKPSAPTPIVLRFDSKGVIPQALKASQVTGAKAMTHIAGVGIVIVSQAGIFKG